MSSRARCTVPAVLTAALVVLSAGPAQALPEPTIPSDVSAAVDAESLRRAEAWTEGTGVDLSGARVDAVHELFMWSTDFAAHPPAATRAPVRHAGPMSEPREETDEPNLHPGPTDEGGQGGMATREVAAQQETEQDDD